MSNQRGLKILSNEYQKQLYQIISTYLGLCQELINGPWCRLWQITQHSLTYFFKVVIYLCSLDV